MGIFSKVGGFLNNITGATSAAKLQNNFNYATQKEFAQNAHQWEVEDLEKAGLNPILSAGGAGATAGGAGGGAAIASGIQPLDLINGLTSAKKAIEEARNLEADQELKKAQTMNTIEMLPFNKDEKNAMIQRLNAGTSLDISSAKFNKRRASGKSFHANLGKIGGGYDY